MTPSIVIVGGGFAGTTLARELQRALPRGASLTLISEESYTTFNPMLAEAVGAAIFPEHAVAPIRAMLSPATRFVMATVKRINTREKSLNCDTLAGPRTLAYDHLVLAFGNRARLDLVPGMAQHALPLKTVGDALHIRNVVLRRAARIELESDPVVRRRLGRFIVVGGGFSGVEVAGSLADCLASIKRYYPRIEPGELGITLLHDIDRLLPELPARLGLSAMRSLEARTVEVRLGARVAEVTELGVRLSDGPFVSGATVICTIGTRPNTLVGSLEVPKERGRIVVAPDLSVPGHKGVWALGDCALVPTNGGFAPPTAQFAVQEAKHLASNLFFAVSDQKTKPFAYRSRGMMASVGHLKGVAEVLGVPLSGLAAWLVWRAYYLSRMPTLGRKLRIFVEWTWGMFFPTDVTHLRFTRSSERDSPGRSG
ncbi:MAG TPA: NAD(P)/FAD-dependent oxidoreductase [Burkholderiales bacterium]|nr:NAD(P)/FAD-dependent oxidoreductase [Burkholderiales bacterium]